MDAKVNKATDCADILDQKGLFMPGMVINEKVVFTGHVPREGEITSLLTTTLTEQQDSIQRFDS